MNRKWTIINAYQNSLSYNKPNNSVAQELISQEKRLSERKIQSQGMSNKITELQTKKNETINTLDGRILLF